MNESALLATNKVSIEKELGCEADQRLRCRLPWQGAQKVGGEWLLQEQAEALSLVWVLYPLPVSSLCQVRCSAWKALGASGEGELLYKSLCAGPWRTTPSKGLVLVKRDLSRSVLGKMY